MKILEIIDETNYGFYSKNFKCGDDTANYILEAFPRLYGLTLSHELKGVFTKHELILMVDVMNVTMLSSRGLNGYLMRNVPDACALDQLDEKCGIDALILQQKIENLTFFQRVCLDLFCFIFWESDANEGVGSLEKYIKQLT